MNDFLAEEENEQTEKMEERNPMLLKLLKQRTILIYGEITQELAKTDRTAALFVSDQ